MAATRKLQAEIDRCLKKVGEGVAEFEEIWSKLQSSTGNASKYQDDLKKEIKKLQRYRDQIRSWLLLDEIKDKSLLLENRKLIETQMERFKHNEKEAKKKMFSKEGLVSQNLDPVEKERNDVSNWITTSIDALNVQFDQFECEVELLTVKRKLAKEEAARTKELKARMERHAYHIKMLETLLRMLDNMSVEVDQILRIKDDVDYYIDSCLEEGFKEDELIYEDIKGLEEIELFGFDVQSPRVLESTTASSSMIRSGDNPELTSAKDVDNITDITLASNTNGKKLKPLPKQKPNPNLPEAGAWLNTSRSSQSLPLLVNPSTPETLLPATASVSAWDMPADFSYSSLASTRVLTFATVAANTGKQSPHSSETIEPLSVTMTKKLPSLLELCVEPPFNLGSSTTSHDNEEAVPSTLSDVSLKEQLTREEITSVPVQEVARFGVDFGSDSSGSKESSTDGESPSVMWPLDSPVEIPVYSVPPPFGPSLPQNEYDNFLARLDASSQYTNLPHADNSTCTCMYFPPTPLATPYYYPNMKEDVMSDASSVKEFYCRISSSTLLLFFYCAPGTEVQLQAARALKHKNWRFHTKFSMWFRRLVEPMVITETYEKCNYSYFDFSDCSQGIKRVSNFVFEYVYLEDRDLEQYFHCFGKTPADVLETVF